MRLTTLCLVVGVCLLVLGCTIGGGGGQLTVSNVRKGTDGLKMEFIDEFPPKTVFEASRIILGVQLENEGATDIESGIVTASLEQDYMRLLQWNRDIGLRTSRVNTAVFDLDGKRIGNPVGGKLVATADISTLVLERQTETHTSTIVVTACYAYQSIFQDSVCIDTNIFGTDAREKICEVKDLSSGGQGGPVGIKKVEISMLPHSDREKVIPQFTFHIVNGGGGEIVDPGQLESVCSSAALDRDTFNKVKVNAVLGDQRLTCNLKEGEFFLLPKRKTFSCRLIEGLSKRRGSYIAPLIVTLDYGYTQSISKKVEIRRIV